MKVYTYGDPTKLVLLLLPGTCCHHSIFDAVIPLLTPNYSVLCVSYDGFDETEPTVFPDMLTETQKIEDYLLQHCGGRILAAYGCSLGGSFVGLLIQRQRVQIEHGILGSSDLDQGSGPLVWLSAKLMAPMLGNIAHKGKLPHWLAKRMEQNGNPQYTAALLKMFGIGERAASMAFVSTQSIFNQFYSDMVTPLEDGISVPGTTVHCFYAVKMGEKYEGRYRQHFQNPDIRRHAYKHEELFTCHPAEWAAEVNRCCGLR